MGPITCSPIREDYLPVSYKNAPYEVSRWGDIWSRLRNKFLMPYLGNHGYLVVNLRINGKSYQKSVHRLVAETFLGPIPDGYEVNHKDGNKLNNCVTTLEYITHSENVLHSFNMGLQVGLVGGNNPSAIFTEKDIPIIRKRSENGETQQLIANDYGVCIATISLIVNRKNWSHVG